MAGITVARGQVGQRVRTARVIVTQFVDERHPVVHQRRRDGKSIVAVLKLNAGIDAPGAQAQFPFFRDEGESRCKKRCDIDERERGKKRKLKRGVKDKYFWIMEHHEKTRD